MGTSFQIEVLAVAIAIAMAMAMAMGCWRGCLRQHAEAWSTPRHESYWGPASAQW
jgi:hypothetical protein